MGAGFSSGMVAEQVGFTGERLDYSVEVKVCWFIDSFSGFPSARWGERTEVPIFVTIEAKEIMLIVDG